LVHGSTAASDEAIHDPRGPLGGLRGYARHVGGALGTHPIEVTRSTGLGACREMIDEVRAPDGLGEELQVVEAVI
jgi:hypothetical protein